MRVCESQRDITPFIRSQILRDANRFFSGSR
jgi:hypothetical protein